MPEASMSEDQAAESATPATAGRSANEVALEMMKFIAVTTGFGKGTTGSAGFSGKPTKSAEEYADALLGLFEKCRTVVEKTSVKKP